MAFISTNQKKIEIFLNSEIVHVWLLNGKIPRKQFVVKTLKTFFSSSQSFTIQLRILIWPRFAQQATVVHFVMPQIIKTFCYVPPSDVKNINNHSIVVVLIHLVYLWRLLNEWVQRRPMRWADVQAKQTRGRKYYINSVDSAERNDN